MCTASVDEFIDIPNVISSSIDLAASANQHIFIQPIWWWSEVESRLDIHQHDS